MAARLGEVLASLDAADAIASGDWKSAWLVKEKRNVRIVRKWETVERVREENPAATIVQIWIGPYEGDLKFVKM